MEQLACHSEATVAVNILLLNNSSSWHVAKILKSLVVLILFLYVFGKPVVHFHNFLLCCPSQRSAPQSSAIPGGNPPGDWQSAVGWGDTRFKPGTAGQQSGVLPLSHHTSLNKYCQFAPLKIQRTYQLLPLVKKNIWTCQMPL